MSRLVVGDQVLDAGPSPGASAGRRHRAPRWPARPQDGAEVAGGVAVGVLDLQAEPDVAGLAHHRRRGAGQQGGEADASGRPPSASGARSRPAPARAARSRRTRSGMPSKGRATKVGAAPPGRRGRPCSACPSRRGRAGGGRPPRSRVRSARVLVRERLAMRGNLSAQQLQHVAGRSLMTAVTPRSRQVCRSLVGVDRPHVDLAPALTRSPAQPRVLAQLLDARADDPVVGSTTARSIGQWCALSTSITTSSSGARLAHPLTAVNEKLMIRPASPPGPSRSRRAASTRRRSTSPP